MEIGSKGLENANLVIPQATTLAFMVVHTDAEGALDHRTQGGQSLVRGFACGLRVSKHLI
jgi:hypothetical protein